MEVSDRAKLRPYDSVSTKTLLSDVLDALFSNDAEYAIYGQKTNIMTGKPWKNFEIAVGVCKLSMAGCDDILHKGDYVSSGTSESASADSLNDEGETAASAKSKTMNNDEDKNVEGLMSEISKSKEAFDKNKAKSLSNKICRDEAGGICARYRDIESKYLELKKQIRRSKKNKMCYACSKFITS